MRRVLAILSTVALAALLVGCTGSDGKNGSNGSDGTSCTVTDNGDGTSTITCEDGTNVTVSNGQDGGSCTIADNGDGTSTITCEDGTTVTITDGQDGGSCSIADNGDGSSTITCDDGTVVVVHDGDPGQNGGNVAVTDFHGTDYLQSTGEFAAGKYFVNATITGATADAAGVVTVDFTVENDAGDPVTNIGAISANIDKLMPATAADGYNKWVPYIWHAETVSGNSYPNPNGTVAYQGYREGNGTLTNNHDGSYRYVFATNISAITVDGTAITYERNRLHRVSIMMGGHSGATDDAIFDFVPDGTTVTDTRDIVRTETCQNCHGDEFHGHGGDRISVENCATCHVPGATDAQSGESLDLKVMIHKIHMGGELPTVAGPDGDPWATADNGTYAIWGYGNRKISWEKVGFPAVIENCAKCHDGSATQSDHWKTTPTREACGSCHDDLDIESPTTTHAGGQRTDDSTCATCHAPPSNIANVVTKHDFTVADPRNIPEFTAELTMSAPANGTYYTGDEAPVVTVKLSQNGTPLADHRLLKGSAQGCTPTGNPASCPADTDGKFAGSSLFVHGPRANSVPVLTTNARAQILSTAAGPFTFATATSLVLKVDLGLATVTNDDWGTPVSGLITVAVPAGTYTVDQLVTLFNGSSAFAARAIAYNQGGFLGVRSRNLAPSHAIQLQAGDVTTAVFAGDVSIHDNSGFTTSNTLASAAASVGAIPAAADDPKVTLYTDRIEYQLDPVTDLVAGTYVVNLELGQLGRVSATNYRTPTVAKLTFQVGQAAEEKQIAGNCNSCHQSADGKGFVLDYSRHFKIFDNTAADQCTACHDYLPQLPDCTIDGNCGASAYSGWTGSKPISKRVHGIHFGSSLLHPLGTVDYSNGDPTTGRNWDITFPQDVRNCQSCHVDGETSGSWASNPNRLACSGCHDGDAALTHMKLMTYDPTPDAPWSGDEAESCAACH